MVRGEGHEVTLKVEAGPEDLADILEQTYKDLGQNLKVPGFRKGKVPKKVIDSHLGEDYVRVEAIKNGLPTLYVMGVMNAGIVPVSDPEIDLKEAGEEGRVVFEARVEVKPEVQVSGYRGIELEAPETAVTEEDLQNALEDARDRFATLEVVEARPAEKGDYVMFDFKVFTDGVPVEGESGTDRMIEIGAEDFLPGFDEQVEGARRGDILDVVINFPAEYPDESMAGKPATFRTIIKEVKRKVLPELNDDLAKEVGRFETLDEFKEDLRSRIAEIKKTMGERELKEKAVKAVVENTVVDLPESMIERQVEGEIEQLEGELSERGMTLEAYLQALKGTRGELEKAIRDRVVDSLKTELVLDAVAASEDIEVSDDEAEDYIRENAIAAGGDPKKILSEARKHNRISNVKANLRLSKAADLLAENAVVKTGDLPQDVAPEPSGPPPEPEADVKAPGGGDAVTGEEPAAVAAETEETSDIAGSGAGGTGEEPEQK